MVCQTRMKLASRNAPRAWLPRLLMVSSGIFQFVGGRKFGQERRCAAD